MSLKAKLEAVIYAAEEPVTLAQLAALFAAEALEWKAAEEAARTATAAGQDAPANEPLPLLHAAFDYLELDPGTEGPTEAVASETAEPGLEQGEETPKKAAEQGANAEPNSKESVEAGGEAARAVDADAEVEAKRLARLRDREVRAILRGMLDELISDLCQRRPGH
jgi:segregation and condensation protein B